MPLTRLFSRQQRSPFCSDSVTKSPTPQAAKPRDRPQACSRAKCTTLCGSCPPPTTLYATTIPSRQRAVIGGAQIRVSPPGLPQMRPPPAVQFLLSQEHDGEARLRLDQTYFSQPLRALPSRGARGFPSLRYAARPPTAPPPSASVGDPPPLAPCYPGLRQSVRG